MLTGGASIDVSTPGRGAGGRVTVAAREAIVMVGGADFEGEPQNLEWD